MAHHLSKANDLNGVDGTHRSLPANINFHWNELLVRAVATVGADDIIQQLFKVRVVRRFFWVLFVEHRTFWGIFVRK